MGVCMVYGDVSRQIDSGRDDGTNEYPSPPVMPLPRPTSHPASPPLPPTPPHPYKQTHMLRSMTVMAGETTDEAIRAAAVCPTKMLAPRPSPACAPLTAPSSSPRPTVRRRVAVLLRASDESIVGVWPGVCGGWCVCGLVAWLPACPRSVGGWRARLCGLGSYVVGAEGEMGKSVSDPGPLAGISCARKSCSPCAACVFVAWGAGEGAMHACMCM